MKLFVVIVSLLGWHLTFSQSFEMKRANAHLQLFEYEKAITYYSACLIKGEDKSNCIRKIAFAYSKLGNCNRAAQWYRKLITSNLVQESDYLFLAQQYQQCEKYDSAAYAFSEYNKLKGQLINTQQYLNLIQSLKEKVPNYSISSLSTNSDYSEMGPCIYKNHLLFSSNRPILKTKKEEDANRGGRFYSLFDVSMDSVVEEPEADFFSSKIKGDMNLGPICFYPTEPLMYLTMNKKVSGDIYELAIYTLRKDNKGKWSGKPKLLPMQSLNGSVAHPSVTPDGLKLYFASDMAGGYGGMDLYVCDLVKGFTGKVSNLGPEINTAGNEVFPFITENGLLYFASDGHPGLGGLDIYVSKEIPHGFSSPYNMGAPVNSNSDDFALITAQGDANGFFTSDRKNGNDDIYSLKIIKPIELCHISGTIKDRDKNPLEGVTILFEGDFGIEKKKCVTDKNGEYHFVVPNNRKYKILVEKQGFISVEGILPLKELANQDNYSLEFIMVEKGLYSVN